MTNFSNPYSTMPGEPILEQRTSVMAIIALVCSLICFLPALPALGVVLGIIALVMIGGSNGRLSGRGLSIAAIIIGLILTFLQIAAAVAISKIPGMVSSIAVAPTNNTMTAIEAKDYATARANMITGAGDRLTDADFDRLRTGYQSELGAFKRIPQGWEFFTSYSKIGALVEDYKGNQGDIFPMPAEFENGFALVVVQIDKAAQGQNQSVKPANIIVVAPTKNKWMLYEGTASTLPIPGKEGTTIEGPAGTKIEIGGEKKKSGVTIETTPDKPKDPK